MSMVKKPKYNLALFLSIFFGWLGLDRFYLLQPKYGIIKLLTFGGFGIWWLIDIIIIFNKAKNEFNDKQKGSYVHLTVNDDKVITNYNNSSKQTARWIEKGESVEISGYRINDGMIYFGENLQKQPPNYRQEPALINPSLPMDKSKPDISGLHLSYWPSYGELHPESRAAYIQWLATGKNDKSYNIGYVFLYYYGLERRIFIDGKNGLLDETEISLIVSEIIRLRKLYSHSNGSFDNYSKKLLNFLTINEEEKYYENTFEINCEQYEPPLLLSLALGQLVSENKPLPYSLLLAYAYSCFTINKRTPGLRCIDEMQQLFSLKYKYKYGDGKIIKPIKSQAKITYSCASANFFDSFERELKNIIDISKTNQLSNTIEPLFEECQEQLDEYSRFLGKYPEKKSSLQAIALLPKELFDIIQNNSKDKFIDWFNLIIKNNPFGVVQNEDLFKFWEPKNPDTITKQENNNLIIFLEKLGLGIEPDIRFNNQVLIKNNQSIIFNIDEDNEHIADSKYSGIAITLQLASHIAKSDGTITIDEKETLENIINEHDFLTKSQKLRLHMHLEWLFMTDLSLNTYKKKLESLDDDKKVLLVNYLITIAGADGFISSDEIKVIEKIYKFLGFEPQSLYNMIHKFEIKSDTPTTIIESQQSENYIIPKNNIKNGFVLDKNKIHMTIQDTNNVSKLLNEVFIDDEQIEVAVIVENSNILQGFNNQISSILFELHKNNISEYDDFDIMVRKFNLMPQDVIDKINEKTLDEYDEFLIESDSEFQINQELLKELVK
ncbi:MAG: TerB N-terminal domain-containing protein [bacterium]